MKTLILVFLLISAAAGGNFDPTSSAHADEAAPVARRMAIGLSPFLEKSAKDDVYRRVVGLILEDLPLKSSLGLYDAYNLTNITWLEIPDVRAFQSSKTRANQFKESIQKLRQFLAMESKLPESKSPRLNFTNAVRIPQFLDFASDNLISETAPLTIVMLGSPLHLDPMEPGFSMVDGYFPSDGHLMASREQSIYGLKNRKDSLRGVSVHFGWLGDPWVSAIHQEKIRRFWALYLDQQGGKLGAFCGDLATLFNAARTPGTTRAIQVALDKTQSKVEMLRITRDVNANDWITREGLSDSRPAPPTSSVGPMKIGIRWKGDMDLDLYAAATSNSETLFFEHTRSPEGYYFKDHRHSPDREYEFIEFESPVDIHRVQAEVNFFAGDVSENPSGEVRIEFEGKIYSSRFQIAAHHGNQGRTGSSQRRCWTQLDIPSILGLRTSRN